MDWTVLFMGALIMELIFRKIDLDRDKEYVLECHCRVNYECDTPWARTVPYAQYRDSWFALGAQAAEFTAALLDSMEDERTLAVIIDNDRGERIGCFWVSFHEDRDTGFRFADVQDLYIEESFRRAGIASQLLSMAEDQAKANGAKVIRSGTGCENAKSIGLHEKMGYYTYRYEFEKVL